MSRLDLLSPGNRRCLRAPGITGVVIVACALLLGGCAHTTQTSTRPGLAELDRQAAQAFDNAMLERAEPLYRSIIERQPDNHDAYFMLGNTYTRMGHLDAAVTHYEKALELSPGDARVWYNLYLARVQQAIDTLEQGLVRTPTGNIHHEQMFRQLDKMYDLYND